jgi:putative integral membrane protein (TIGR02587 family)
MATRSPWAREIRDLSRAFAGAYILSVPLLFTMEMWWIGEYALGSRLIAFMVLGLVANFGLSYVVGFRRDGTIPGAMEQAINALAIGCVAAFTLLLVLNRIQVGEPLDSIVGMVVIQAVPLSIGASVANQMFGGAGDRSHSGDGDDEFLSQPKEFISDVGATAIGGVLIAFSIAPTDEVPMLAAGIGSLHLIGVIGFTLVLSYGIVFVSEFDQRRPSGPFQHPLTETVLAYLVSLVVAAVALYLFHQIGPGDPASSVMRQVLILGLPATIGGAAGRLVI